MKVNIGQPLAFSEIGGKERQEDAVYPSIKDLTTEDRCFVLCDGLGGRDGGEVASNTVCSALGCCLKSCSRANKEITAELFEQALRCAYDELDKRDTGALKKMGTTMTCLCLHENGYLAAHIGDSRIYHIRPADTDIAKGQLGIVYQSSDHSLVNDLLKAGKLTKEEAEVFPQRNIVTRAMLSNQACRCKADIFSSGDIKAGDYFFICSDGILEKLSDQELCSILAAATTDKEKFENIKNVCYGNTKDNFTCILVPVNSVECEAGLHVADKGCKDETVSAQTVVQKMNWNALSKFIALLLLVFVLVAVLSILL